MSEQPSPEPQKSKAEAAPKAAASSHGADPSRAQAYIPLPGQPKPGGRGVLLLAALVAAGALGGTAWHFREPAPPPTAVAAAAVEEKVLTVTDADISVEATRRVREAPAPAADAGAPATMGTGAPGTMGTGASGTMGSGDPASAPPPAAAPAPQTPAAPAASETRASSPLPVAPPELISPAATAPQSALTARGQEAVRSDGYSIFSMRLIDDVAQDGDVVQISVDGVPMSYLSLTHAGATLEIPLKKGESHRITVTAVRDGNGGVTLGLQTSAGMIVSRNMAVGESDSWTIDYK